MTFLQFRFSRKLWFCFLLLAALLPSAAAYSQPSNEEKLRAFMQKRYGALDDELTGKTQYFSAFSDLNGDGNEEAIVYLVSTGWCGSGGCSLAILSPEGDTYKKITDVSLIGAPITELPSVTNGWKDLTVADARKDITGITEITVKLSFDGKTYPSDTSKPFASEIKMDGKEKILIPDYDLWKNEGEDKLVTLD